jgi:hypothetical protein
MRGATSVKVVLQVFRGGIMATMGTFNNIGYHGTGGVLRVQYNVRLVPLPVLITRDNVSTDSATVRLFLVSQCTASGINTLCTDSLTFEK